MCAVTSIRRFTKLDTPEKMASADRCNLPTPAYRGRIVTLDAFGVPIKNMQMSKIRRFTNVVAPGVSIYVVYVRLLTGVKLPLLYEAQPMQSMDVGTSVSFYVVYVSHT